MLHLTQTQTALPKRKSKVEAGRNEEGTLVEIEGYNKVLVSFFVGEDRDGCVLGIVRFTDYYTGRLAWLHHPLFVSATHPGDILCNTPSTSGIRWYLPPTLHSARDFVADTTSKEP